MKTIVPLFLTASFFGCGGVDSDASLGSKDDFSDQESWNPTIILTREAKKRAVVK